MKYSYNYSKLQKAKYTTIRRYSKGKVGKKIRETYPSGWHFVKILRIERRTIIQLSDEFLLADTDCKNREEAINLINSFYKKPINPRKEKLYVYYLKKI